MKVHLVFLATLAIIIISAESAERRQRKNETVHAPGPVARENNPRGRHVGPRNVSEGNNRNKPRRNKPLKNVDESAVDEDAQLAKGQAPNQNRKNAAQDQRRMGDKKRRLKTDISGDASVGESNSQRVRPPRSANASHVPPPLAAAPVAKASLAAKKRVHDGGKKNKTSKSPGKHKGQAKNKTTKLPKPKKAAKKAHSLGEAEHPTGVQPIAAPPAAGQIAAAAPAPVVPAAQGPVAVVPVAEVAKGST